MQETTDPAFVAALRERIESPSTKAPTGFESSVAAPFSSWLEATFGQEHSCVRQRYDERSGHRSHEGRELSDRPTDDESEAGFLCFSEELPLPSDEDEEEHPPRRTGSRSGSSRGARSRSLVLARVLFVSHDRTFLKGLANRVLEIGGEDGTGQPVTYGGTYEEYVAKSGREAPGVHA